MKSLPYHYRMLSVNVVGVFFLCTAFAKLPCDYLSMLNGNVVVESGTRLCLGNCPGDFSSTTGIYVGKGQTLYFANFKLVVGDDTFELLQFDNTVILTCFSLLNGKTVQCFGGVVPVGYPDETKPAGYYLTGRSGGTPISSFDPWTIKSTLNLDAVSTLSDVLLQGLPSGPMTGWRLVTQNFAYTFTDKQQLIVGDVPVSIIAANSGASVIANGPVVVREGLSGCAVPLFRPNVPSATLIYTSSGAVGCDLSESPQSFTYSVELNRCYPSLPFDAFQNSEYFQVSNTMVSFYSNPSCSTLVSSESFRAPLCSQGWSIIQLPIAA